jgi:fatty acid desaturase
METLSEYMLAIHQPMQTLTMEDSIDTTPYIEEPLTTKEKIFKVIPVLGYILLGLFVLLLTIIAIWGVIQWPWMIVFFFFGLILSLGRGR